MNWNSILTELLKAVIGIAVPIVAIFICKAFKKLSDYLKERTQNIKTQAFIDEIENAIVTAVSYVSQTMVTDLKKEGKFDKDKAAEALNLAYNTAVTIISDKALNYLKDALTDETTVQEYLTSKIEETVYASKLYSEKD